MADNYLERKMEEYRSGRLGSSSSARRGARPAGMLLKFPPLSILITAPSVTPLIESLASQAVAAGCGVAIAVPASREATEAAQRSGARLYPSLPLAEVVADITARRGGVDVVFYATDADADVRAGFPSGTRVLPLRPFPTAPTILAAARANLFLAHPDNAFLLGEGDFGIK